MSNKTAVAVGLFDGIHDGHRLVLNMALSFKELKPAVFTFNTESVKFKHGKPFEYIYTNEFKIKMLNKLGFEEIYSPDFDQLKDMEGEEFARTVLCEKMNAGAVVCGGNFRFGKNASCGIGELKEYGEKYGFEVRTAVLGDDAFSSEKFRSCLRSGDVQELLRRNCPYRIFAEVTEGNRIGRTIDFPTINQNFSHGQLVPKKGVYATETILNGIPYVSVTNVGVKPTVEDNIRPLAETHILDYNGDLYGKTVEVRFRKFVRSERKFSSVEELKRQISADIDYIIMRQ